VLDVVLKLVTEMFNHGAHGHCRGIAKGADGATLNPIGDAIELL